MQYREFGNIDFSPSALGFGCMRLPTRGDDSANIDEDEAISMIRNAIDNGVNYVDTARPYHGGESEPVVGRALGDGYREKVGLATKLTLLFAEEKGFDQFLSDQLEKLRTDHIDFYLLHGLNNQKWERFQELDVFDWLERVKSEGKIRNLGFSFHDDYETFERIVDSYQWDFCQIQYNYLDKNFQAGRRGLEYAAEKGMGVVIMEPLRGGQLAASPPESISSALGEVSEKYSPVEWALNWLWNQPQVSVVLSGMSKMEQVKENLQLASQSEVGMLTDREEALIEDAGDKYKELQPINCTGCGYCEPCPNGVGISTNFRFYNQAKIFDAFEANQAQYTGLPEEMKATSCVDCGQCVEVCPQQLDIPSLLEKVDEYFTEA